VENGPSSTNLPLESQVRRQKEPSQIENIARGMRILRGQLIFLLALAAIGSFAFQTGHFAHFPYAWFDAKEEHLPSRVIADESVHGSQFTGEHVDRATVLSGVDHCPDLFCGLAARSPSSIRRGG